MTPGADPVRNEIVLGRVSAKPSQGRLAVFDLRWERRLARKTQLDARHSVTVAQETESRNVLLFPAVTPASSMDPKNNRRWTGGILRTIQVKRKGSTVDAFINQISLDRRISDLRRATPRHGRLGCRTAQGNRKDYDAYRCVVANAQTSLLIIRYHIVDEVLAPKNRL
jgi:hypothetical protein